MKNWAFFIMLGCIAVLSGCKMTQVPVQVMRSAEINLKNYKNIAIVEVTGEQSDELIEELSYALSQSTRFELLDRDASMAAKLGKPIGTAVLIFGKVSHEYHEDMEKSERKGRDSYGERIYVDYKRIGKARASASFELVDAETAKIIATKKIYTPTKEYYTQATDKTPDPINSRALVAEARKDVVPYFMKCIEPYTVTVYVTLFKNLDELAAGNNLLRERQWDEAIATYKSALGKYPESDHYVHFNLGVAYEYSNRFQEALEELNKAYAQYQDEFYLEEIQSCKRQEAEWIRLQQQMQTTP